MELSKQSVVKVADPNFEICCMAMDCGTPSENGFAPIDKKVKLLRK